MALIWAGRQLWIKNDLSSRPLPLTSGNILLLAKNCLCRECKWIPLCFCLNSWGWNFWHRIGAFWGHFRVQVKIAEILSLAAHLCKCRGQWHPTDSFQVMAALWFLMPKLYLPTEVFRVAKVTTTVLFLKGICSWICEEWKEWWWKIVLWAMRGAGEWTATVPSAFLCI